MIKVVVLEALGESTQLESSLCLLLWPMQKRTNLTQDEVMALEEARFFLFKKSKFHPKNLFSDDANIPVNKPTHIDK
jgi:hypothetical protein